MFTDHCFSDWRLRKLAVVVSTVNIVRLLLAWRIIYFSVLIWSVVKWKEEGQM